MGFITHLHAFFFFPDLTFNKRTSIRWSRSDVRDAEAAPAIDKYRERGFEIVDQPPLHSIADIDSPFSFLGHVAVTDSWTLPVKFRGMNSSPDYYQSCSFDLVYSASSVCFGHAVFNPSPALNSAMKYPVSGHNWMPLAKLGYNLSADVASCESL